jgi:cytochrome c oxidase cbb3-type subunit 4
MDINTLRGIMTILLMVAFIGVCLWAYSGRRKKDFEDASNLPFDDEDIAQRTLTTSTERKDND